MRHIVTDDSTCVSVDDVEHVPGFLLSGWSCSGTSVLVGDQPPIYDLMQMTDNLTVLRDACVELISNYSDFWTLAGLTDCSYEEGVRNKKFRLPVESYAQHGVSPTTLERLRLGTNGNLKAILERRHPELGGVTQKVAKGQDLSFEARTDRLAAKIEVKLVYDCTTTKYYRSVAADFDKLSAVRKAGFIGDLYLAVFFVQMPMYDRPSGYWAGRSAAYHARSCDLIRCGIRLQFLELIKHLKQPLAWPSNGPWIRPLDLPTSDVTDAARRRLANVFKPDTPWMFDPQKHLVDAAVGASIWEVP